MTFVTYNDFQKFEVAEAILTEIIWIKQPIQKLKFAEISQMKLFCDNHASSLLPLIQIFIIRPNTLKEKSSLIVLSLTNINSNDQLAYILTPTPLDVPHIGFFL
ncbi:hypothetical protein CR513_48825, partial [Mucuna pruriens]